MSKSQQTLWPHYQWCTFDAKKKQLGKCCTDDNVFTYCLAGFLVILNSDNYGVEVSHVVTKGVNQIKCYQFPIN